jgi:sec-independent protein translocase protein TatB
MFDIAWSEMLVIGAVALVVIGPKDLPKALRACGEFVGKVKRMASEFQGQFNDAMREAEIHDLKKQVEDVGGSVQAATKVDFNPIQTIREEIKDIKSAATGTTAAATVAGAAAAADATPAGATSAPPVTAEPYIPPPEMPPPVNLNAFAPPEVDHTPPPDEDKPKRARKAKAAPEGDAA